MSVLELDIDDGTDHLNDAAGVLCLISMTVPLRGGPKCLAYCIQCQGDFRSALTGGQPPALKAPTASTTPARPRPLR
jgi:hypothetical protein